MECETLHGKLLDAVRSCQTNLGGKQELVSESSSCVSCLCTQFENVFRHKLKTTVKSSKGLLGLTQITAGFVSDEIVFWHFIKNHLMQHEINRFEKLVLVSTDVGRGRAWLRSSLNEHSLERYLQIIVGDHATIRNYYDEGAFLLDEERSSTLANMAAGLSSIYFNIQVDNPSLNGMPKPASNSLGFIPNIINAPLNTISYKTIQPRNENIDVEHSDKITKKRSGKQKRAKIIMFGGADESESLVVSPPPSRVGKKRTLKSKNSSKVSDRNSPPQRPKEDRRKKLSEENPSNNNDDDDDERKRFAEVIQLKNEAEETNKSVRVLLDTELEHSSALRLEIEKLKLVYKNKVDKTTAAKLEAQSESDTLRNHLKKYVGAVQGFGQDENPEKEPRTSSEQESSKVVEGYKEKLVQAAEMHGELLEFNERLTKRLRSSINLLHNMRTELVDLRGPVTSDDRVFQIEKDPTYNFSPGDDSLSPVLINIWIPSVFQNGKSTLYHHVYQVYIKVSNDEWNIFRRYSHFHELHTQIRKKFPIIDAYAFPPKKTVGNKGSDFVEIRRKELQNYLRFLISNTIETHEKFQSNPTKQTIVSLMPFFSDEH